MALHKRRRVYRTELGSVRRNVRSRGCPETLLRGLRGLGATKRLKP
jgi:hypothetical protein